MTNAIWRVCLKDNMSKLGSLVRERILILDGAMGTMIQQYNLTEEDFRGERFSQIPGQMKGNNDLLCLTRPDVIQDIHRKYLAAGADIIETNTFSSTRVSMADYHVQDYVREMNLAAVRLARKVADEFTSLTPDKPRFVAGSVGPTNKTCSMSPDVNNPAFRALSYDELADAYREQMEALLEGGVDALLIETIFDTLNAKAAIFAAGQAMETVGVHVPLMLSVTVSDIGGRTLSGQTLDAFLASVQHADIFFSWVELLLWRPPAETFPGAACCPCTLLYQCLSQRRTAQQFGHIRPDSCRYGT